MKRALALALLLAAPLRAQNGDVKGEEQPPLNDAWKLPAPKPLSPEEELATFRVDEGLRVELVACEPLVRDPVCATFDERGRLWVCEMSAYMRDYDGHGEDEASGSVVVLSDEDGDGRMDKRVVFMDHLVLPRAVAPTRGGALVIAPPNLYFARDTDGDGRADEQVIVDTGLQGIASPEHAINGLLPTLDNWFVCANAPVRYRFRDGKWERGRTAGGGQWGITEDRWGRIFLNDNSNPLRCDLYPSHYAVRNPNLGVAPGMNVNIAAGTRPHPSHMTPGVNRGYRKGLLGDDGRLQEFTGACAPWIYEGDALPERYRGSAIVCEPCGNLLHRFEITYDEMGRPKATTAAPDGAFLTSTDERFRPVWLNEGPDGALYVVDMYRGLLQHKLFVTSWLRKQMEDRELAQPIGRGRIWRVTSGERKKLALDLTKCSWTELANCFDSPNRWLRKTAQRLFVEQGEGERDAADVLRAYVRRGKSPASVNQMHALWAMEGLDLFDEDAVGEAWLAVDGGLGPPFGPRLFVSQSHTSNRVRRVWFENRVPDIPMDRMWRVVWQVLLTPGDVRSEVGTRALSRLAWWFCKDDVLRGAILSGLYDREFEFLEQTLDEVARTARELDAPGTPVGSDELALVEAIGGNVVREGRSERLDQLSNWIVGDNVPTKWQLALTRGALAARSKDAAGKPLPIRIAKRPQACDWFAKVHPGDATVAELFNALIWPGKPGTEGMFPRELTDVERSRFERGRGIFEQTCASCHQLGGRGDAGIAPPLRDSPWVLGDATRVTKVVLHGLRGPIKFGDLTWDGEMPGFTASDDDVASILTYLRREWNHAGDPIEPDFVRDVRKSTADRKGPWSVSELSK